MKFQKTAPPASAFQLAPMIDIVFLLLIFFIVTWQFSRAELDLKVSVPTSTEGKDSRRALSEIIVNIREDGALLVNGQALTENQLFTKLSTIARVHENQPVRLRGDGAAAYQQIVRVIDICQRAGIWNLSFATQKPQGS